VHLVFLAIENWLVFKPTTPEENWVPPPSPEVQDIYLIAAGGTRIHAWWWPAPGRSGAILYCHGNAGNLSSRGATLAKVRQALGNSILIFDYPGYGKSGGRVSEKGCYFAADAAHDWLIQEQKIAPEDILLYGGSLGGGVAVDLASRREHRALVLAKTFSTLPDVAHHLYPWLPVRRFMHNRFDNLGKIGRCHRPLFMVHGTADHLIPYALARRLFEAANDPKKFMSIPGGDHNHPLPAEYFDELSQFLNAHARVPGRN
jgi:uncharacterized protein